MELNLLLSLNTVNLDCKMILCWLDVGIQVEVCAGIRLGVEDNAFTSVVKPNKKRLSYFHI